MHTNDSQSIPGTPTVSFTDCPQVPEYVIMAKHNKMVESVNTMGTTRLFTQHMINHVVPEFNLLPDEYNWKVAPTIESKRLTQDGITDERLIKSIEIKDLNIPLVPAAIQDSLKYFKQPKNNPLDAGITKLISFTSSFDIILNNCIQ